MASHTITSTLSRRTAVRLGSGGLAATMVMCGMRSTEAQEATILEANKALVHRVFEEAMNSRAETISSELYAPDFIDRGTWARQMPGPAGMPVTLDQFHTEFPDVTVTVEVTLAENDLVATVAAWHGTHPPAGTHLVGRTLHLFRIANEQIIEEWSAGWNWITPRSPKPPAQT